jgi:hypothetical protein
MLTALFSVKATTARRRLVMPYGSNEDDKEDH